MQFKVLNKPKAIVQIFTSILFIAFLVSPGAIPDLFANIAESSLGMITLLSIAVILFLYSNISLAILFLIVSYELIRRSSNTIGRSNYIQYTPTQEKRDKYMKNINEPRIKSLEEDIVSRIAPIGICNSEIFYIESIFRPASSNVHIAFNV